MAQRDRGVVVDEQFRGRLTHQLAAPDHHHMLARHLYVVGFQQGHNAFRSAGHHVWLTQVQQPDVHQMQAVGILAVVDKVEHARGVVVVGQGQLDKDGIDVVVPVKGKGKGQYRFKYKSEM